MPKRRSVSSEVDADAAAAIEALRGRGGHRHDPVRFRFIEALARRAAAQHGAARRILDDRLAALLAAYGGEMESTRHADSDDGRPVDAVQKPPRHSALADLAGHIALNASSQEDGVASGDAARGLSAPFELKMLPYFRRTWSRLSADRRLSPSHATVPDNPGPLNSHHLVHQALTSMRDLSPGYLSHFMSYVDALLWLDDANGTPAATGASAPREASPKKSARGKAG
jgi:hypothetical protein